MLSTGPASVQLAGDVEKAKRYIHKARVMIGGMLGRMERLDLSTLRERNVLEDGTIIAVTVYRPPKGSPLPVQRWIEITVPEEGGEEEENERGFLGIPRDDVCQWWSGPYTEENLPLGECEGLESKNVLATPYVDLKTGEVNRWSVDYGVPYPTQLLEGYWHSDAERNLTLRWYDFLIYSKADRVWNPPSGSTGYNLTVFGAAIPVGETKPVIATEVGLIQPGAFDNGEPYNEFTNPDGYVVLAAVDVGPGDVQYLPQEIVFSELGIAAGGAHLTRPDGYNCSVDISSVENAGQRTWTWTTTLGNGFGGDITYAKTTVTTTGSRTVTAAPWRTEGEFPIGVRFDGEEKIEVFVHAVFSGEISTYETVQVLLPSGNHHETSSGFERFEILIQLKWTHNGELNFFPLLTQNYELILDQNYIGPLVGYTGITNNTQTRDYDERTLHAFDPHCRLISYRNQSYNGYFYDITDLYPFTRTLLSGYNDPSYHKVTYKGQTLSEYSKPAAPYALIGTIWTGWWKTFTPGTLNQTITLFHQEDFPSVIPSLRLQSDAPTSFVSYVDHAHDGDVLLFSGGVGTDESAQTIWLNYAEGAENNDAVALLQLPTTDNPRITEISLF